MPIPDFQTVMLPVISLLQNGDVIHAKEIRSRIALLGKNYSGNKTTVTWRYVLSSIFKKW